MSQNDSKAPAKPKFYHQEAAHLDSAMPEFMAYELFGSLIPTNPHPYYLQHIAHRTAAAWVWGDLRAWRLRVTVGLELLTRVPEQDFAKLAELISKTMQTYYGPQKAAFFRRKDRRINKEDDEAEVRFGSLFTQYLHDFEGLYGHIGTIFAFAKDAVFRGLDTCKPPDWWVKKSAKTKASKLETPVSLKSGPVVALTEGYDRHFRNAIAHTRWKFRDRNTAEMWDVNENGKETWRARLSYEDCEVKLENLVATVMALESAYFLFVMRNQTKLVSMGALRRMEAFSAEESEAFLYDLAQCNYQLELFEIARDKESLKIKAKIIPNFDIPQVSEILVGGATGAQKFEVEIKVFEVELPRIVFGFIRNIVSVLQDIQRLVLEVQDPKGNSAGRVILNSHQLDALSKVDDRKVGIESLSVEENSLTQVLVRFTERERPRPIRPTRSSIIMPPPRKIIIP